MLWFAALVLLACLGYFAWIFLRPRRLSSSQQKTLLAQWQQARFQTDPHRRLLEADAVIARVLDGLGFKGSMGDKLRAAGTIIPRLDDVWAAHKLRNRIAHEPGLRLTDVQTDGALEAFERVLRKFT